MDAIEALRKEREALVRRLKNLDGAISLLSDHPVNGAGKRRVSRATRKAMSDAAKKRWAAKKKGQ